ncbi:hypothetical protein B7494_g3972 [Chlorociboria aeruginascens]|nr:hypothetical protein B7494_g3972 [Chlorociboria aeruginascens]
MALFPFQVLVLSLLLRSVRAQQIINGQIFTPGIAIVDAPQPNTPLGGDTLQVALDVSSDGQLQLPPYPSDAESAIHNITIFLSSYVTGKNFTITNGTASAGNASLGDIMLQETTSTVKHISIRQNFRLNGTDQYTIFDLPIQVTNSISEENNRPSCDSLENALLSQEALNASANSFTRIPGTAIETTNSGSGEGLGGSKPDATSQDPLGGAGVIDWRASVHWASSSAELSIRPWDPIGEQHLLAYKKEGMSWKWMFHQFLGRAQPAARPHLNIVQARGKEASSRKWTGGSWCTLDSLELIRHPMQLPYRFLVNLAQIEDNTVLSRVYHIIEVENIPTTAELKMDCLHDSNGLTFKLRTAQRTLFCISFVWEGGSHDWRRSDDTFSATIRVLPPGPERLIPGCVVMVANRDGIVYSNSFGAQSVDPGSPLFETPLSLDTTMWIASCTKLLTAIAVLQCVEKGLLDLDDDISTVLSEWKEPQILIGFHATTGEPILEKAKERITLRMLLTHQSGMGYSFTHPDLEKFVEYRKKIGKGDSRRLRDAYFLPLLFEPGTSWAYGVGTDWAGQMVERVNNNQSLGSYMEEHIWKPLNMTSTTFRPNRLDIVARRSDMTMRDAHGTLLPSPTRFFPEDTPDDHGGGGLYSCPGDYIKVLIALLKNDGTLLAPASIDALFTPCLSAAAAAELKGVRTVQNSELETKKDSWAMGGVVAPVDVNYALGGLFAECDAEGGRKAGTVSWGGLPNLSWAVDRVSGIAFMYASQLLPPGDKTTKEILGLFEKAIYSGEIQAVSS